MKVSIWGLEGLGDGKEVDGAIYGGKMWGQSSRSFQIYLYPI